MRAVVYEGPWRVRVRDKPDPRIEHPGDAILKVTRAAICGSDLRSSRPPPSAPRTGAAPRSQAERPRAGWAVPNTGLLEHRAARGLWMLPAAAGLVLGYGIVARAIARS